MFFFPPQISTNVCLLLALQMPHATTLLVVTHALATVDLLETVSLARVCFVCLAFVKNTQICFTCGRTGIFRFFLEIVIHIFYCE